MKYLFLILSIIVFSEVKSKVWLPENDKDIELFERIVSTVDSVDNTNNFSFISSRYSSCDWCKLIFESKEFSKTSFIFPTSDNSILPLIRKEFNSESIYFSDDLFYLINKLGLEQSLNYVFHVNRELKYFDIQEINKKNYKTLLRDNSKFYFKRSDLVDVPTGSYQMRLRCTIDKGTYFTDIRNRFFFVGKDDTQAILQKPILQDFEYDSLIRMFDKRSNVVTEVNKLKLAKIGEYNKVLIESIKPFKGGLEYLVALNYLIEINLDTFMTAGLEFFIEEDAHGNRLYKPLVMNQLNRNIDLGYATPFTYYQSLNNDEKIIRIDINKYDLDNYNSPLPEKIAIAVKSKINPVLKTTSDEHRTWEFMNVHDTTAESQEFFYMDRSFFENEKKLRNQSGAKYFYSANNYIYLYSSNYVYSYTNLKEVKLDWLEKISNNNNFEMNVLSMEYIEELDQYFFSIYTPKGLVLLLANSNFELDTIDFYPIEGFSNNIYVLNRTGSYVDKNKIYTIEFGIN